MWQQVPSLDHVPAMTDPDTRVELKHACAFCGEPAAMPREGGLQLSVIDERRRVIGWAVHRDCLAKVLAPMPGAAFESSFPPS
jgi:hypothetical protein